MLGREETPRRVLERIVLRRGSFRGIGRRCGRSTMWFWRQLRQNKSVDLVKTEKVLDQLGVPLRFFYEEMQDESSPYDPAWLLEYFRDDNGRSTGSFLASIEGRLSSLLERPSSPGGERHRRQIAEPEEGRFFNRDKAKLELEQLMLRILELAEAEPSVARGHMSDLAHILLIWGAIQRSRGRIEGCSDAYRLAYRLAVAGRDPKVIAIFDYYASHYLSMELDQPALGFRFAERACAVFQQLRDPDMLSQALVQTAIALYDLGRFDEQRSRVIGAMRLAPRQAFRVRATAWIQLGNAALIRGNPRAALGKMLRAHRWSQGAFYMEAFVLRRLGHIWREIKMAGDPGRPVAESVKAFRRSISISEKVGQGFEAILAVLDLAEVLISADRLAEAAAAARGMSPLIEKLGEGSQIYSQWLDFLALLLQGAQKASQLQVILLREALHAEASDVRPRLSR